MTNDLLRASGEEMERGRERALGRAASRQIGRERERESERLNRCGRARG